MAGQRILCEIVCNEERCGEEYGIERVGRDRGEGEMEEGGRGGEPFSTRIVLLLRSPLFLPSFLPSLSPFCFCLLTPVFCFPLVSPFSITISWMLNSLSRGRIYV